LGADFALRTSLITLVPGAKDDYDDGTRPARHRKVGRHLRKFAPPGSKFALPGSKFAGV